MATMTKTRGRARAKLARRGLKGLTKNRRVSFRLAENKYAMNLARYGLHAKTIARCTGLTTGQVYYRLHKIGEHLRTYRNGKNEISERICTKFTVS